MSNLIFRKNGLFGLTDMLAPWDPWLKLDEPVKRGINPAFNYYEADGRYVVEADMPGISEENVSVTIVDNHLHIIGERAQKKEQNTTSYYVAEQRFGSFKRTFALPKDASDRVEATLTDGVLTVTIEKNPEAQPKKIEVTRAPPKLTDG